MADDRIETLAQAIRDTLWATGEYRTGVPHSRPEVGVKPAYQVWWDGFSSPQEPGGEPGPLITTHRFQVDMFFQINGANIQDSHRQFWRLIQQSVAALRRDHRFGGLCLRSRVTSGSADLLPDGSNPMLAASLVVEADVRNF